MSSNRVLRSKAIVPAMKSPQKKSKEVSKGTKTKKDTSKSKSTGGKHQKDVVDDEAVTQAKEYLSKTQANDGESTKKKKRAREEDLEDDEQLSADAAEAEETALLWMESDKYALEIVKRKEDILAGIAHYKPKIALAKKSLEGAALDKKLKEIRSKIKNNEETLVALRRLNDKRYEELYNAALSTIVNEKKTSKRRRVESEESETDNLDVSDGE